MLVDVIWVGDVWIWVGFWRRLGGSGFGSKMEESKVRQNGENPISRTQGREMQGLVPRQLVDFYYHEHY